jgi:hypothetical protein
MKKTFVTLLSVLTLGASFAYAADVQPSDIDAQEKTRRASIEKVASCAPVLNECKKLGFVAGGFKEGNGLWRNCFYQAVAGKAVTLKGKEVKVSVDAATCKADAKELLKEGKEAKKETKAAVKK